MKILSSFALHFLLLMLAFVNIQAQKNPVAEAAEKMVKNDINGAVSILDSAIQNNQNYFEAYKFRASLRSMKGDLKGATDDLSKAIELKPKEPELYYSRARYRSLMQDFQGALNDFNSAIEKGFPADKVFTERAFIKRILKDTDGAIKDYQMAINIRPHSVAANMGYAAILNEKGEADAAIKHLEDFLARIEKDWDNQFPKTKLKPIGENVVIKPPSSASPNETSITAVGGQVGVRKYQTESLKEAEAMNAETEQILNLAIAYSNLASMYEKKGNLTEANVNIEKSFKLNRGSSSFAPYNVRGRIRLKAGDYEGAVADFTVSIRFIPFDTSNYLNRGLAFFLMGKSVEAQKDFDIYLEKFPKGKEELDKRLEEAKQRKANEK